MVLEIGKQRDYLLKTAAGRLFHRNRHFLRQRIAIMPGPSVPAPPTLMVLPLPVVSPVAPPMPPPDIPAVPARPACRRRRVAQPDLNSRRSTRIKTPSSLFPETEKSK